MLYVSNIVDDNTIEVSDSRTLKTTVVAVDKLRTEGTEVFGLTKSRVVVYRDAEDFLARYALRQRLVNRKYEYIFEYVDNMIKVSDFNSYTNDIIDLEVPDFVDIIGDRVFEEESTIRSVYIPDSVVKLGEFCFRECTALTKVVLPEGITELGMFSFDGCKNLESINLPKTLTTLGEFCFSHCKLLKKFCLPSTVTYIGSYCFDNCHGLEDIDIFNTSITELGRDCFSACIALKSIELPSSLQKIGEDAFVHCNSLKSIELPNSLQEIGVGAFALCTSLEEVRIPSLLNMFENCILQGCPSLRRLTIVRLSMLSKSNLEAISTAFDKCNKLSTIRIEDIADNSISDIETFIRYFKDGVPSIKTIEIDKSVGVSLSTISEELGIEIRLLEK